MNSKQLTVVWLLAAWLGFAFFYTARHVEPPRLLERGQARVAGQPPPVPVVTYDFVWEHDARTFFLLAVPGLIIAVPLILTLGRKK